MVSVNAFDIFIFKLWFVIQKYMYIISGYVISKGDILFCFFLESPFSLKLINSYILVHIFYNW